MKENNPLRSHERHCNLRVAWELCLLSVNSVFLRYKIFDYKGNINKTQISLKRELNGNVLIRTYYTSDQILLTNMEHCRSPKNQSIQNKGKITLYATSIYIIFSKPNYLLPTLKPT
jgi:hypothetical protein